MKQSTLMYPIVFAALAAAILLGKSAHAGYEDNISYITDAPVTATCKARIANLKAKTQGQDGVRIACDCTAGETMCWAFDKGGEIIAWKHGEDGNQLAQNGKGE